MITLDEIRNKLHKWETFATSPDSEKFPHYNPNHVFDIGKSVRWNQEQVDIANKARAEESTRLRTQRNALYCALVDTVKEYIMQETHCNETQSDFIYTFVTHHSYCRGSDFIEILDEIIEFYNDLKKAECEEKVYG